MKKTLIPVLALLTGLGVGGAGAYGTTVVVKNSGASRYPTTFVSTGKILAPLVYRDGHLSGYVEFEAQLEVPTDRSEFIEARLPVLLNAVNMKTYRTPMASGPDGMLPDIEVFRKLLLTTARETFGRDVVKRVAVTQASPA